MAGTPSQPRLSIVCPSCGAGGSVPSRLAGQQVRCSRCGTTFQVAAAPVPAASPAVAASGGPAPLAARRAAPAPTELEAPGAVPTRPEQAVPAPAPDTEWRVGDIVLGLYEVTAILGQGGMGRVYRVRHRGWDVELAVKTPLRKALEAAGGAEAFENEAETWVNLGLHPHVVSCYYVRRVEGIPRVFAEYVDGGSLQEAVRDRRIETVEGALDVAIQFAWGLHYAHELGLVHRDVKPGNVMLTADGVAKVTDFGLAGARVAEAPMTGGGGELTTAAPGGAGGTPAYMSPEQWAGRPLTRRTDVWSWALALLEVFVGQRAWEVGPAGREALERCLASPFETRLPVPSSVGELLRRCLREDAEQRPRTLAEAAAELALAYEQVTGRAYARSPPHAGRDTADSLNNRAVSLLDLGRPGAESLWAQGLRREPQHLECTYNQALHAWTHGRIGDDELLSRVQEAQRAGADAARTSELMAHVRRALGGGLAEAGQVLKGEPALALALTPEPPRVLAATQGGEVRVWRASGEPQRPLAPVELRVKALAVAPDGQRVLLAGEGAPAQLWEIEAARPLRTFPRFPGITSALAISGDGRIAVAGGSDRAVRVFEVASGHLLLTLEGHTEAVTCVAVNADATRAASGGLDGTVRAWDLTAGRALASFADHRGRIGAVALSADGRLLLSGGEDRTVRQWDLARLVCLRTLAGPGAAVSGLALSADARGLLVASLDRTLRVFDTAGGTLRGVARLDAPVAALAAGPNLRSAWVASGAGVRELRMNEAALRPPLALSRPISVLEVAHRDAAFHQRVDEARRMLTQGDLGRALALAREARTVPGHQRSEEALTLWDDVTARLPRKGLQAAWEAAVLEGHRDPVLALAVSADSSLALSGDLAGAMRWWDMRRLVALGSVEAHQATLTSVALTADGRYGVSASWDGTLKTWPRGESTPARVLEGHGDYVNAVTVSPSGRTVLSASSDQTLRLWDLASGRALGVLEGHEGPVSGCAFGPDGQFALSASWDATLRLWDVPSRTLAGVLEGHETSVGAVALSPDGRQAVSGGLDGAVRVWDLRWRRSARVLTGHTAEVTAVVFLPDGRHAVSASRDKSVRVWDLTSGACLRALTHAGAVLSAVPLLSGNALLCAGTDLALRLWRLDWEAEPSAAGMTLVPAAHPTVQVDGSAWEEIRRAARPAAARKAAVQAARQARRRLPSARVVALAAVVLASVAGGLAVLWPRHAQLAYSHHQTAQAREDLENFLVDLSPYGRDCSEGGYDHYLERARERVVTEDTLACLAQFQQPTVVDAYLRDIRLDDQEATLAERKLRNAVSLLAALDDRAVPFLCAWLQSDRRDVQVVVARALAAKGGPAATDCLVEGLGHASPAVRSASAGGLRLLAGLQRIGVERAWELLGPLARDPDAGVRLTAVPALALFDFDHSLDALAPLEKDANSQVAEGARSRVQALRNYRNLNPDRPY